MPRGYLKNASNASMNKKRGGGSKPSSRGYPRKKLQHQSKSRMSKRTGFIFNSKSYHDGDGFHHDSLEIDDEQPDYHREYDIFCEKVHKEQLQKQNAEIEYHKNLNSVIDVSLCDSNLFMDHCLKMCSHLETLELTHRQIGDDPEQGTFVFNLNNHPYLVENFNFRRYEVVEDELDSGVLAHNYHRRIFRKVNMCHLYSCDSCGCEAAFTKEPDPSPVLTFCEDYDVPDFLKVTGPSSYPVSMEYSKEYNASYFFRPFVTTRYPKDYWTDECPYCADPNDTIHYEFCMDCFNEKFPISIAKMKLFFHRLLKKFQISPDLEISIIEMIL
jgi:hypothetical protein